MSLETVDFHDSVVLWPKNGYDRHGQPKIGALEETFVQWDYCQKEMADPNGNKVIVESTAVVSKRITVGSILWKGSEDQWYGAEGSGTWTDDRELMEVITYEEIQDTKGRNILRTIGMNKYRNTLPEES